MTTPTRRYHDAKVHPAGIYRVRGSTGGAVYVSFTVEAGAEDGAFPSGTVGVLNDTRVRRRRRRARSSSSLGGPRADRGWLALAADASRLTVRHYWEQADPPAIPPAPDLALADRPGRRRRPRRPGARPTRPSRRAIRRMATYVRSRTIEQHREARRGRSARVRVPHPPRVPAAGHAGRPRARRRRRGVPHGAVPARTGRGAGDHGPLAGVPLRQREPLEPPAADVRLPPRPGAASTARRPSSDDDGTFRARDRPRRPGRRRTGSTPRAARSVSCSGASCSPRARSTPHGPRSCRSPRWPDAGYRSSGVTARARRSNPAM